MGNEESQKAITALVFVHRYYQGLGALESPLLMRGYHLTYADPDVFDFDACNPADADLIVFLGGPFGVDDEGPLFIAKEVAFAERRIATGRPVLGICLGAQIIAKAMGGAVWPGVAKELGWNTLDLTAAGLSSPLRHLSGVPVLHWHEDMFSLPAGCAHLASTEICLHQAFSFSSHVLALQFHVEVDPVGGLEDWISDSRHTVSADELACSVLRDDTANAAALFRGGVTLMIHEWLNAVVVVVDTPNL